ncbi:MAG: VanZ family protein [Faecousia sp.]
MIALLFLAWLAVIAAATLTDRTPDMIPAEPELVPFHSYRAVMAGENREILRSNFMNVALFYPAGLLACELLPKSWRRAKKVFLITALLVLASAGIEFCQYHFALGQAEVDDVIHNALGALIGALVCTVHIKWNPNKSEG